MKSQFTRLASSLLKYPLLESLAFVAIASLDSPCRYVIISAFSFSFEEYPRTGLHDLHPSVHDEIGTRWVR